MPLTDHEIGALLKGAETAGDLCLRFCRFLSEHGVNLADYAHIKYLSLELQKLLNDSSVSSALPTALISQKSLGALPEDLVTADILQPGDPRIRKIFDFHFLQELKQALRVGTACQQFPVGTIIPDIWTNPKTGTTYLMPLVVVDYRMVKTARHGNCFGAILLRQNALPISSCFDKETNIFTDSVLRHFLNDDCGGYTAGCSDNLLGVVSEIIIGDNATVRFFPPSMEELHFDPYDNPELEDLVWEYFRDAPTDTDTPCSKRVFYNPEGRGQYCWTLSAYRGTAYFVWYVTADGSVSNFSAITTCACAPACVVIAD